MANEKEKLNKILNDNPDPSKWSKWIKFIIAVLSALLGALGGSLVSSCSSDSNDKGNSFILDTFNGHEYVIITSDYVYGNNVLHSPDCFCLK